ncbi:MAG: hypothetical protein JNJ47_08140 [Alphaproteobacteria bacterium]|nr:hypothetical protein [Alphaproteobacteria bacterium]
MKKTYKEDAAFARPNGTESNAEFGLTKREYFAIQILNGMMANAAWEHMSADEMFGVAQKYAVKAADALIEELNK